MYNFDEKINRTGTNAMKLEGYKSYIFHADDSMVLPFSNEEFIHMWVADMEFAVAPEIIDAIRDRLDRKILGYTSNYDDSLFNALNSWCKKRYDWEIKKEELVTSDGVIPALERLFQFILDENSLALFNTPAYGQFSLAADRVNRKYITSDLIKNDDGTYDIDFEDLDEKMGREDVKLFILCSPHNPIGRVWSEDELKKLAELIEKHDLWVISDEIHCDLRRRNAPRHIPLAKVMANYKKIVTCMAASKTFNLAGLQESSILISDEGLRNKWKNSYMGLLNPLSHEGTIAAYTKGEPWLEELTDYLDENFKTMNEFFKEHLPKAVVTPSETTYLGWVDLKEYFSEDEDIEMFFAEVAGVLLEGDKTFVDNASRMIRLNLACPRAYLLEGLNRIRDSILEK